MLRAATEIANRPGTDDEPPARTYLVKHGDIHHDPITGDYLATRRRRPGARLNNCRHRHLQGESPTSRPAEHSPFRFRFLDTKDSGARRREDPRAYSPTDPISASMSRALIFDHCFERPQPWSFSVENSRSQRALPAPHSTLTPSQKMRCFPALILWSAS